MAKEVILPRQGNTVESCVILEWKKNEGDKVKKGEVLCEVETDKTVFEIESPADGILLKRFFKENDDVPVMTTIAVIGNLGEDISSFKPVSQISKPKKEDNEKNLEKIQNTFLEEYKSEDKNKASPFAKSLAISKGVDIETLSGSGPQGMIIERDVLNVASEVSISPAAAEQITKDKLKRPIRGSGLAGRILLSDLKKEESSEIRLSTGRFNDIPIKGIRKIIKERMLLSAATTVPCTLFYSTDASTIIKARNLLKSQQVSSNFSSITINDMLIYIISKVLQKHPRLNSHIYNDTIREFENVSIGFAVDTPRGLMVPVLYNANLMDLITISTNTKKLISECIEGNINPDLLKGSTFTITNLGNSGIEYFTPVINPPENAILGIGTISKDNVIKFSLTFNHIVIDGKPAAEFLKSLEDAIKDFDITKILNFN